MMMEEGISTSVTKSRPTWSNRPSDTDILPDSNKPGDTRDNDLELKRPGGEGLAKKPGDTSDN